MNIDGDGAIAEAWDYKNRKRVPDADAWETIDDNRRNWALDADYVDEYINKMIKRFPRAVAAKLDGEMEKIVALLHDTVEDTDTTIDEIRGIFGDEIAESVKCLTHDKAEPYMVYVDRVRANELARRVKLADLTHNMDLSRLPTVTEKDLACVEKYREAYKRLV